MLEEAEKKCKQELEKQEDKRIRQKADALSPEEKKRILLDVRAKMSEVQKINKKIANGMDGKKILLPKDIAVLKTERRKISDEIINGSIVASGINLWRQARKKDGLGHNYDTKWLSEQVANITGKQKNGEIDIDEFVSGPLSPSVEHPKTEEVSEIFSSPETEAWEKINQEESEEVFQGITDEEMKEYDAIRKRANEKQRQEIAKIPAPDKSKFSTSEDLEEAFMEEYYPKTEKIKEEIRQAMLKEQTVYLNSLKEKRKAVNATLPPITEPPAPESKKKKWSEKTDSEKKKRMMR